MKLVALLLRKIIEENPDKEIDLSLKPVSAKVFHTKLKKGVVTFMFEKKDGDIRIAQGTLQLSRVPIEQHPKGVKQPTPLQINFFDTVKKRWRSMSSNTRIYIGK